MAQENQGQLAGPADISKIGIASLVNEGKIVDVSSGIVELSIGKVSYTTLLSNNYIC